MHKIIFNLKSIILLTVIMSFTGCNGTKDNETATKETTYSKVLKAGTIKVGYLPYPPGFIKDPNTKELSGIFHDVLVEAGRNLDLKIEFTEEVGWGTMIEAIKTGRVDMVCTAVWPTSQRGKQVDFSMPLYYSPIKVYVKKGNTSFDGNLSKINSDKVSIATLDGEMTSIIAKVDYPNAKSNSLAQSSDVSQLMLDVANGKSDVTFIETVVANEFMKNNPRRIQEVKNVNLVRIFPNVMMTGKGESDFLSMLNTSIGELVNTGFIDRTISKYEPYPNSFYRLAQPYRTNK